MHLKDIFLFLTNSNSLAEVMVVKTAIKRGDLIPEKSMRLSLVDDMMK